MKYWRTPLDIEEISGKKYRIVIIEERCKGCNFCIEYCPQDELKIATYFNAKGYHPPVCENPEKCLGCGFCEIICPEFCIFVEEEDKKD